MTRATPTREELFARDVIEQVGRWTCTYGDSESDGAVGWWLTHEGTRVGGVEVTVVGDADLFETMSAAGDVYWDVPEAQWCWMLSYAPRTNMKEVRAHLRDLVVLCEKAGVVEPEHLPMTVWDDAAVRWYRRSGTSLTGFPGVGRRGVVDVVPEGGDACVLGDATCLADWVEDELDSRLARKVRRFGEILGPERHLFLIVHDSGMPMTHYHPLAFGTSLPQRDPVMPANITGLWLVPNWGRSVLWGHREHGWMRAEFDSEHQDAPLDDRGDL